MAIWHDWADRLAARAARRAPAATGFTLLPEPRALGEYARGRQIAAGSFHLAGKLAETRDPWAIAPPSAEFAAALHGFGWLDDLAAFGDGAAKAQARRWVRGWIARYGRGRGPGWRAAVAGRRVLRWIEHGVLLTAGAEAESEALFRSLAHQAEFLARRHAAAAPGLAQIEALAGWLQAGLMLKGLEGHAAPALTALTRAAADLIAPEGGIPSRNPEELLHIATLLGWCRETLDWCERPVPQPLADAMLRAARALKALRHADGGLPRFHGGGAGAEGALDRALALTAPGDRRRPVRAMGFVRLEGGRTTVIADAAAPPPTPQAQAATLGFELTSARRPVVVQCGAGRDFGADWDLAGRETMAASTLSLDGTSSARVRAGGLAQGPREVTLHRTDARHGTELILSHDGWAESHGLTHTRHLDLSADGRALMGDDALTALTPAHRQRLDKALAAQDGRGLGFALRFHLHPAVEAEADRAGVTLTLPSGERWLFRFDDQSGGHPRLSVEPSVWLEPGRRAPHPCRQIVLRATVAGPATRIGWTLAKAHDTPLAIRDTGRDEALALPPDYYDRD